MSSKCRTPYHIALSGLFAKLIHTTFSSFLCEEGFADF